MELFDSSDVKFLIPSNIVVTGATFSGKSYLTGKLFKYYKELFDPIPNSLLYCYFEDNELVEQLENSGVKCHIGLPTFDMLAELTPPSLVCIDDGIDSCDKNYLMRLFQRTTHHHQISLLFLSQSLFQPAPLMQIVKQQAHYVIFLKSLSQTLNMRTYAMHIFGSKFKKFLDAYDDAVNSKGIGSYLRLSLHPKTPNITKILTGFFPEETLTLYKI